MKNNKIITSWDKIEPSDSANDRMLSAILEKNRSVHDRKDKVNYMSQRKNLRIIPYWKNLSQRRLNYKTLRGGEDI